MLGPVAGRGRRRETGGGRLRPIVLEAREEPQLVALDRSADLERRVRDVVRLPGDLIGIGLEHSSDMLMPVSPSFWYRVSNRPWKTLLPERNRLLDATPVNPPYRRWRRGR